MTEPKNKQIHYIALDRNVMTVALEGEVEDWAAYIGAVPGNDHEEEWQEVARQGTKLDYKIAKILFPQFAKKFTWRD